jgi:hypothetical protein
MAKLKVFAVHDSKVEAYLQPFFCRTTGEALRMWEQTCNDGKSMMATHPTDFSLFEVAEYDEATGRFTQHEVLRPLGTAVECKRISEATITPISKAQG